MLEWLGLPVAASAHAGEVDRIMVLDPLADAGAVRRLERLLRLRAGPVPAAARTRRRTTAASKGRWSTWVEGGVLVAEIVLLAFFSIPFWRTNVDALPPSNRRDDAARGRRTVRVERPLSGRGRRVRPHRRSRWSSPDNPLGLDRNEPVGKDDIIAINRMNLPVGKPAVIYLSSKDVIHSFGLPQMRVKQDAIPGIVQPVWFTPTQIGRVGHRVLAAVRPRPLPHEGRLRHPDAGRRTTRG